MSLIDLKEIPQANTGEGNQDSFEAFARDFLFVLGYKIEEGPSRGADGGKDFNCLRTNVGYFKQCKQKMAGKLQALYSFRQSGWSYR